MKLKLRGHHLLCLLGFQGYGYDKDFISNMDYINKVRKDKDTLITLTNSPDDICIKCPNLINNICTDKKQNELIEKMDNEVLSKFNINKEYESLALFKEVTSTFNTLKSIESICHDCKWCGQCLFYNKLSDNFK